VLVNAFRSVLALGPQDLVAVAYLATGKVAPDYEGIELNVGPCCRLAPLACLGISALGLALAALAAWVFPACALGSLCGLPEAEAELRCVAIRPTLSRGRALAPKGGLACLAHVPCFCSHGRPWLSRAAGLRMCSCSTAAALGHLLTRLLRLACEQECLAEPLLPYRCYGWPWPAIYCSGRASPAAPGVA
jgi:hypothetical protein